MMRIACLFFILFCFSSFQAFSQSADTSFVLAASKNALKKYEQFIEGQSSLYNGSEYVYPERTNEDHPFYKEFDWLKGSVDYHGEFYDNVAFLYDLTSDNLITENFYNGEEIVLVKAKVKSFTLEGEKFIHLNGTSMRPGLPTAGFYRLYYDGPTRVVGRIEKTVEETIESNAIERYFRLKTKVFVLKDDVYRKISNRSELFKLFKDKRPALRAYASKEKISISRLNPDSFGRIAAYYDLLNQTQK
jgi:hypothetical protein